MVRTFGKRAGRRGGLAFDPSGQDANDIVDFLVAETLIFCDAVPFCEAGAAAGCGGVLGDEDGVAAHRGLAAVVFGLRGRYALVNEFAGVSDDGLRSLLLEITAFDWAELKSAPKFGLRQGCK